MKKTVIPVCLAVVLISASMAMAQPGWSHHGKGRFHDRDRGANIENLRFLKMLEVLDMSDEQSEVFIPIFHQFRRELRDLRYQRRAILDTLAYFLEQESAEQELDRVFNLLHENLNRIQIRTQDFFQECKNILSPYQLGRLLMFHERFEKEVLESLREFRRKGPGTPAYEDDGN